MDQPFDRNSFNKDVLLLQRILNILESIQLNPDNFEEIQKICMAKGMLDGYITIKKDIEI